jgi:sugar diacid utilization regulator
MTELVEGGSAGVLAPAAARRERPTSGDAYRAALVAFASVAQALSDVDDLDRLLHLIAMRISELAGVQRCSVFLREEETALFRGQVVHPGDVGDERIKRLVAGVPADGFTREIVQSKRPVVISNALADPRPVRSTIREFHIRSMLGVPMVLRGEVIGIVFLDTEDERQTFSPSACEIASTFADLAAMAISQARMTAELRASVATIAHSNQLLRQAAAIDDRLTSLVLDGGDLQEIATAVAELTGKPTAIHDAQHRRLAAAAPPGSDQDVLPRLLDPEHCAHPSVAEALEPLKGTRGGVIGPLPASGLPQRFLVAPVTMRDEECGRLVILEYGSRFRALDLHVARRAATNVALELAAERRAAAAEWDARASLAADLIRGTRDDASLERRAHYLGVDLTAPRVLCLVTCDASAEQGVPPAEEISSALARCADGAGTLAAGVAEGVVALLDLDLDQSTLDATAAARGAVERALDALGALGGSVLSAAISTRCAQATDYVRAYAEARQVMSCLRSLARSPGAHVLTADDLGPGRLLLGSSNRADARRFSQDALGALLADDEGARDLLRTLQVFFDAGRSVRRSALALGVHENTIRYRLARIEDATALAVATSSDDQLSAQLALLVLRLDGALPG